MARGSFLLLGSGEFEPWSAEPETAALERASGDGSALVVPTASAPEGDDVFDRWAAMGMRHYASMGVPARVVPVKVRVDAERPDVVEEVRRASLIFFSGGSPRYLAETLDGTAFWRAVLDAIERGAVYAAAAPARWSPAVGRRSGGASVHGG